MYKYECRWTRFRSSEYGTFWLKANSGPHAETVARRQLQPGDRFGVIGVGTTLDWLTA